MPNPNAKYLGLGLMLLVALAGCGQKSALFLPEAQEQAVVDEGEADDAEDER